MPALKTLAEPFNYGGHDFRVAVDESGHIFVVLEDIFAATDSDHLFNFDELRRRYPPAWFSRLPETDIVLANEMVFYAIVTWLDKTHFMLWFYDQVIPVLRANKLFVGNETFRFIEYKQSISALKAAAKGIAAAMDEETITGTEAYSQLRLIIEKQESLL